MEDLRKRLDKLRDKCLRCFADEIADFFPRSLNQKMAVQFLSQNGYPKHECTPKSTKPIVLYSIVYEEILK